MSVIMGRITNKKGDPIQDVMVNIINGTGSYPDIIALTDMNGEYDLDYITPGVYTVKAEKHQFIVQQKKVKIDVNKETRLNFTLLE